MPALGIIRHLEPWWTIITSREWGKIMGYRGEAWEYCDVPSHQNYTPFNISYVAMDNSFISQFYHFHQHQVGINSAPLSILNQCHRIYLNKVPSEEDLTVKEFVFTYFEINFYIYESFLKFLFHPNKFLLSKFILNYMIVKN